MFSETHLLVKTNRGFSIQINTISDGTGVLWGQLGGTDCEVTGLSFKFKLIDHLIKIYANNAGAQLYGRVLIFLTWNFVHKKTVDTQTNRQTHTQRNCSENITPPRIRWSVIMMISLQCTST